MGGNRLKTELIYDHGLINTFGQKLKHVGHIVGTLFEIPAQASEIILDHFPLNGEDKQRESDMLKKVHDFEGEKHINIKL